MFATLITDYSSRAFAWSSSGGWRASKSSSSSWCACGRRPPRAKCSCRACASSCTSSPSARRRDPPSRSVSTVHVPSSVDDHHSLLCETGARDDSDPGKADARARAAAGGAQPDGAPHGEHLGAALRARALQEQRAQAHARGAHSLSPSRVLNTSIVQQENM